MLISVGVTKVVNAEMGVTTRRTVNGPVGAWVLAILAELTPEQRAAVIRRVEAAPDADSYVLSPTETGQTHG